MCHARKERVLMIGTDQRITSGPAARTAASRGRIHGCTRIVSRKVRFFSLAPRAPSIHGRYCCKSPKIPGDDFFEKKEAKLSSPINMAPRPSAKSPVSFSLGDKVPHIFIRESHQRPRKILITGGKRLLQQNRPLPDSCTAAKVPHSIIPLGAVEKLVGTVSHSASDGVIRQSIEALGSAVARVRTRESSVR